MRKDTKATETVSGDAVEGMVPTAELAPSRSDTKPDPDPVPEAAPKNKGGRPRGSRTAAAASAPAGGRPSNKDRLAKQLSDQYTTMGMFLMLVAPSAGMATMNQADSCGASLAAWAETNPKVRRALERTLSGAGLAAVLAAHLPIVLAVLQDVKGGEAPNLAAMFGGAS